MQKLIIFISLITLTKTFDHQSEAQLLETKEFVESLDNYFASTRKERLTKREATDIFLIIYSGLTIEDIETFESKLDKEEELNSEDEHLSFFKNYIAEFYEDSHYGEDGYLVKQDMIDIVSGNLILVFMEERVNEEHDAVKEATERIKKGDHLVDELTEEEKETLRKKNENIKHTANL